MAGNTVAVVIRTRIADDSKALYAAWQVKVGEMLGGQPGFLGQEIRSPVPPGQVDWFVIQHFRDANSARAWMESKTLGDALKEAEPYFVGDSNISIVDDARSNYATTSVSVRCLVPEHLEGAFLEWEREVFRAEAKFDGFVGHRLERPVPGLQPRWTLVLTFDTEGHLNDWLGSSTRKELIERGTAFQDDVQVEKLGYGFDFWSASDGSANSAESIFKGNLIVLMVLYPVVFLWGYFVGTPLLGNVPFWIALFIGNLFSTQLLGWYVAPKAFKALDWWIKPNLDRSDQIRGYAIILAVYAASLALYAWLISAKLMG